MRLRELRQRRRGRRKEQCAISPDTTHNGMGIKISMKTFYNPAMPPGVPSVDLEKSEIETQCERRRGGGMPQGKPHECFQKRERER